MSKPFLFLPGIQFPPPDSAVVRNNGQLVERFVRSVLGWFPPVSGATNLRLTSGFDTEKNSPVSPSFEFPSTLLEQVYQRLSKIDLQGVLSEPEQTTPVLDLHLTQFQQKLRQKALNKGWVLMRKLPWPAGKPMAAVLTHDVDLTRRYGPFQLARMLGKGQWREFGQNLVEWIQGKNDYWTFPELVDFYDRRGGYATFFFLARCVEGWGYRYDIRHGKFRRLLKELIGRGHEIGLHSSRYAQQHPERIIREKNRLEKVLGQKVAGVRQHYLNLTFPLAWERFAAAGFRYDASVASNQTPGFVAGTSFPFVPALHPDRLTENFFEIPFSLMDYSWKKVADSPQKARNVLESLIHNVQKVNGIFHVLWHPSNLAEAEFQPLWEILIEFWEGKNFYRNHLKGIREWWQAREAIRIERVHWHDRFLKLVLSAPQPVHGLTLEVVSRQPVRVHRGPYHVVPKQDGVYHLIVQNFPAGEAEIALEMG